MRRQYASRYVAVGLIGAGSFAVSSGCMEMAVMGISALVREAQNEKQINRQREIDRQRAVRDRQNYEQMQKLQRQNETLLRQMEEDRRYRQSSQ